MKLLIITDLIPGGPEELGDIRLFSFLKRWSEAGIEIKLIAPEQFKENSVHKEYLPKYLVPPEKQVSTLRKLEHSCRLLPSEIDYVRSPNSFRANCRIIQDSIQLFAPDIVMFKGIRSSQWINLANDIPTVLDLVDSPTRLAERSYQAATPEAQNCWHLRNKLALVGIRNWERKVAQLVDLVVYISSEDAQYVYNSACNYLPVVIPCGVDDKYFTPNLSTNHKQDLLLFVGMLNYPPNHNAVRELVNEIMPRIWKAKPQTRLVIVGQGAAVENVDDRIYFTGFIEDVRPWFINSKIFVAPLRSGSGVKTKLLVSCAMGIAIVTTAIGAEGIPLVHNKHAVITDYVEDMVSAIIKLLDDDEARNSMGLLARQLAEDSLSCQKCADDFLTKMEALIR